jgi:formyl-CoA transferase
MAQGYAGIMSLTGDPDGPPTKVGTGIADVMCGMYATIGILAALRHRDQTGEGQHIDLSLVDATMAWLINEGVNYMTSGKDPVRRGNAHPNIVPYDAFATADGHMLLAVGNDSQFARFCDAFGLGDMAADEAYRTNLARIENRDSLTVAIAAALGGLSTAEVIARCNDVKVPAGPIHTVSQALHSDQAQARNTVREVPAEGIKDGHVKLLGNPLNFSKTPVRYERPPPRFGEHTDEVLAMLKNTPKS